MFYLFKSINFLLGSYIIRRYARNLQIVMFTPLLSISDITAYKVATCW